MTQELRNLYDAPGRYYHTWEHITACLKELFEAARDLNLSDDAIATLGGAILFHDVIYVVKDGEHYQANEQRSAQFGSHYLESRGVHSLKSMEINELIRETAHGRYPMKDNPISHLMHDIDMSILGVSPAAYRLYGYNVRNELSPLVSGPAFEKIRQEKFLTPILAEGPIYLTEYFQEKYENQARRNLKSELAGKILFVPEDV